MKIVISGGTGLVGKELSQALENDGHDVWALTRGATDLKKKKYHWDYKKGEIDPAALREAGAVFHLAGENIGSSLRWSKKKKEKIYKSRVEGTKFLVDQVLKQAPDLKTFICASAVGYYGDTGEKPVDEEGTSADDFLAKVCKDWEKACDPLVEKGIRVVNTRFGVVLSPDGGALAKMLLPFKLCLGGVLGSGEQYMSWIGLSDLTSALTFCLSQESVKGPVNCVSPNPVTNYTFTKTLGSVLGRPTIFPVPAFMVKGIFGEMGEALFLQSQRVIPKKLEKEGFKFSYPELDLCLKHELR